MLLYADPRAIEPVQARSAFVTDLAEIEQMPNSVLRLSFAVQRTLLGDDQPSPVLTSHVFLTAQACLAIAERMQEAARTVLLDNKMT